MAAAPASAAGNLILLPSIRTSLTPGPPLAGASPPAAEVLYPPGMTSHERVLVGVDTSGKPVSIAVVQRLVLDKVGDYSFAVSGPIADVEAAPGSESEPGLRRDAILWAGFSAGKKTLAARATLRVAPASPLLPLRLSIARESNALVVRGEDTSGAPAPVLLGAISTGEAARALDETRRHLRLGRLAPDIYATVPRTPLSQSLAIAAPLDVRGTVGGTHFHYRLGDGGPLGFTLRVPHAAPGAKLQLIASPVPPSRQLTPPGAATWAEALRRGRSRSSLLEFISQVRLAVARELQYQTFLANPNPTGASTATYVYETATRTAAPPRPASSGTRGSDAWLTPLLAALAFIGAGGLVVLWAHS